MHKRLGLNPIKGWAEKYDSQYKGGTCTRIGSCVTELTELTELLHKDQRRTDISSLEIKENGMRKANFIKKII